MIFDFNNWAVRDSIAFASYTPCVKKNKQVTYSYL